MCTLGQAGQGAIFLQKCGNFFLPIIISFYFKIFTPDVSGLSRAGLLPSDVRGAGQPHVSPYIVGGDEVLREYVSPLMYQKINIIFISFYINFNRKVLAHSAPFMAALYLRDKLFCGGRYVSGDISFF